jgi:hypothetical protein
MKSESRDFGLNPTRERARSPTNPTVSAIVAAGPLRDGGSLTRPDRALMDALPTTAAAPIFNCHTANLDNIIAVSGPSACAQPQNLLLAARFVSGLLLPSDRSSMARPANQRAPMN